MMSQLSQSPMEANDTPLSPLRFLERSAAVFGEKTAIIHGDRRYSYREFADEAQQLAKAIRSRIKPGDRVAFLCPNVPEMIIAHFAVPLAGGVLVALNTRLARNEIHYILEHSEAELIFVDTEFLDLVSDLPQEVSASTEIVVVPDTTTRMSSRPADTTAIEITKYRDFLRSAPETSDLRWSVTDERTPISLNYTSGTTGRPKGVLYSHRGAYLNALGEALHSGFTAETKYLWTLPMFHCNGWCFPWAVAAIGGTQVCLREVQPKAIWEAINTQGITNLSGAPTVCGMITEAKEARVLDSPLRITSGGAPPSPTIISKLESLGISITHIYGLTEVYGPFTICEYQQDWSLLPEHERAEKISRQGVGMLQAETARVVDSDMRDVPADGVSIGEIVLRGNNVMIGYFKDTEATAEAFRGGWFHTGDLGVMHPDGYLQLKDRAKDIVISGGENISTVEVEHAIVSHPDVLDAAVIGIGDAKWGERPLAFVILRQGSDQTSSTLQDHVRTQIAGFKVPDQMYFVDELPRTATGKVKKEELRSKAKLLSLTDNLS